MCDIYKASVDEISVMRGNAIRKRNNRQNSILHPDYSAISCVTLGKSLSSSTPQFPHV